MKTDNYYEILGVAKEATLDEIKRAYRKQAMLYHPDKNNGDKAAEEKFKEVNEAYEVLSSPERRKGYDRFGKDGAQQKQGFPGGFGNFGGGSFRSEDISSIFEEMMGGFGFNQNRKRRGGDINYKIVIDILDAFNGKTVGIRLPSGEVKDITIPSGIKNKMLLRIREQGQEGINGGPKGDLKIEVNIKNATPFERVNDNIFHTANISYLSILERQDVSFTLFNGELVRFEIPQFHDIKKLIRLKNKGFTIFNTSRRGDLYIKLNVIMPKKITKKGIKILKELAPEIK